MFDSERLPALGRHALDGAAIITTLGALVDQLPAIAAGLSAVWTLIRIYETATVQRAIARVRALFGSKGA